MTIDDVISCLFEAKEQLLEAQAVANVAGIDRDFSDLINTVDDYIYVLQTEGGM